MVVWRRRLLYANKVILLRLVLGTEKHAMAIANIKWQLFEQSQFATELGAAVHVAPNANGVLRKIGIRPEEFGANPMLHVSVEAESGWFAIERIYWQK